MRRLRNSRRGGDTLDVDESYQVDAIVSLFAVLLVLLLTLAAASSQSAEPVQTRYKPNDQTGEVLSLRSLQVPFKFREFWSLGEEEILIRYDMEAIIDRLQGEIGTSRTETTIDGVDINFEWFETELGGYRIELNIFDLNAGQWAVLDSVNARDNEALAEWAAADLPAVIYVTDDAIEIAAEVDASMRKGNRRGQVLIPRRSALMAQIERRAGSYSMERVYRAH